MARVDTYPSGTFNWVDLMAKDIAQAKNFYGTLFDWTWTEQDTRGGPPYSMFLRDADEVAGLGQMPGGDMQQADLPAMWSSYVNVADLDEAVGRVEDHGGKITVPPMRVLDAGHMAVITDPEGASLGLWQALEHQGAAICNEPGSFCWNELACRDIDGARNFYAAVFDWDYTPNPHSPTTYYIIRNQSRDNGGLLQMNEQWGDMPSHWSVYFAVDDVDARAARVKQLGGTVHAEPFDIPIGRLTVVQDDQGAHFYMLQLAA